MYKLIEYKDNLNLDLFYKNASERGFNNNSTKKLLIDSFSNEREKCIWILYYNDIPVGSVAAHSLDIFDKPSYRIMARTCVFTDLLPLNHLRTLRYTVLKHQNIAAQFFMPKCIEWAPDNADLYISTNSSTVGSQDKVDRTYCPALEKIGVLTKFEDKEYRGHLQTFWLLNKKEFLDQLANSPRWNLS